MKQYDKGFYKKPHLLLKLVAEKQLTKTEYLLLDILLHLHNIFSGSKNKWFFCTDEYICSFNLISIKTLGQIKKSLSKKGYIQIKQGYSHVATKYKICFDVIENRNILSYNITR